MEWQIIGQLASKISAVHSSICFAIAVENFLPETLFRYTNSVVNALNGRKKEDKNLDVIFIPLNFFVFLFCPAFENEIFSLEYRLTFGL
jgi:hypothetical protein